MRAMGRQRVHTLNVTVALYTAFGIAVTAALYVLLWLIAQVF